MALPSASGCEWPKKYSKYCPYSAAMPVTDLVRAKLPPWHKDLRPPTAREGE